MHPSRAGFLPLAGLSPFTRPVGTASPPFLFSQAWSTSLCSLRLRAQLSLKHQPVLTSLWKHHLLYLWSTFPCLTAPTQKPLPPTLLAQPWPADKVWPEMLGGQPQSSRVEWMVGDGGYSQRWRRRWWQLPGNPGWTWMQVKAERYRILGPQGAQSSHPCKWPQPQEPFPPGSLKGRRKGRPLEAKGIHASLSTALHMENVGQLCPGRRQRAHCSSALF